MLASTAALVTRSQRGDRDAFVSLCLRHLSAVYDFVARLLLTERDTTDVTRAALLIAAEEIGTLDDPDAFPAWLLGIAYTEADAHLRSHAPRTAVDELGGALETWREQRVWATFTDLGILERAVLDLHTRRRLSPEQIASVVGENPAQGLGLVGRVLGRFGLALADLHDPLATYEELGDVDAVPAERQGILEAVAGVWAGDEAVAAAPAPPPTASPEPARGATGDLPAEPVQRPDSDIEPVPVPEGDDRQPRPWRRAAVFAAVLAVTGVLAAYAAPRLAPDRDQVGTEQAAAASPTPASTSPSPTPSPTFVPPDLAELHSEGPGIDPFPWLAGGTPTATETAGTDSEQTESAPPDGAGSGSPEPSPAPTELTVEITEPGSGTVVVAEDRGREGWAAEVEATAEAFDPEGQRLDAVWRSNRMDHDLSTAGRAVFWLALPDGCPGDALVHTVTLEVSDPDGNTATDSIKVEVHCP